MALNQWGDTIASAKTALTGAMSGEKEPMLLLDTTGSMNEPNTEGGTVSRASVVHEAIGSVVAVLAAEDSQAAHEEGGGGLRTVTFAGGDAFDLEDLNPGNLRDKWAQIRFQGTTQIMPGMAKLLEVYKDEFGERPMQERPELLALIITDGEAEDADDLLQLTKSIGGNMWFEVALLGYGPAHDQLLRAYQQLAASNKHIKVTSFGDETDPQVIAKGLLEMLGQA